MMFSSLYIASVLGLCLVVYIANLAIRDGLVRVERRRLRQRTDAVQAERLAMIGHRYELDGLASWSHYRRTH